MDNLSEVSILKSYNYNDIKEKPETLLLLINKFIEVRLVKNCILQGYAQAIDPVTNSIVLAITCKDSFQTSLVPGHAVISISEITPTPHLKPPEGYQQPIQSIDITERKLKIMAWLKENLLPVSESEDKIVFGNASLLPPYTVADICTTNPMVAMQMKKILEKMPQDFHLNQATT